MESIYSWFWTYWGVLVTGIVVGLITTVVGRYFSEEEYTDTGFSAFGVITLIGTVLFSIIWAMAGPFSVHWILVPVGAVSVILFFIGKSDRDDELARGGTMLLVVIGLAYLVAFNDKVRVAVAPASYLARQEAAPQSGAEKPKPPAEQKSSPPVSAALKSETVKAEGESVGMFVKGADGWWQIIRGSGGVNDPGGGVRREPVRDFWPASASPSQQGFLVTSDGSAVRVLASDYLVPLFDTPETAFPANVVDIMKPFRAYYVIRKQDKALLVAEPPFTPQSQTFWVRQSDCYVWATGLAAEAKEGLPVYASEEHARAGTQPLTPIERYTSTQWLPSIPGAEASPPLSRLPLLTRTGDLAAFLCPVNGGALCWINVTRAGNSITLSNTQ